MPDGTGRSFRRETVELLCLSDIFFCVSWPEGRNGSISSTNSRIRSTLHIFRSTRDDVIAICPITVGSDSAYDIERPMNPAETKLFFEVKPLFSIVAQVLHPRSVRYAGNKEPAIANGKLIRSKRIFAQHFALITQWTISSGYRIETTTPLYTNFTIPNTNHSYPTLINKVFIRLEQKSAWSSW